jgi:hypothetical protein
MRSVSCFSMGRGDVDRRWGLGQPAADSPVVLWDM